MGNDNKFYYHDTPGVYVRAGRTIYPHDLRRINKHRAKGRNTMEALARMGAKESIKTVGKKYVKYILAPSVAIDTVKSAKAEYKKTNV